MMLGYFPNSMFRVEFAEQKLKKSETYAFFGIEVGFENPIFLACNLKELMFHYIDIKDIDLFMASERNVCL